MALYQSLIAAADLQNGPQGIQGVQGLQGLNGLYAAQGIQGIQGIQSIQGPQGIQGVVGPIPNLALETINALSASTGTVVHNYNLGNIWAHTGVLANFTANFTNVPTTNNIVVNFLLIVYQGATPYFPSAVQIDGVANTILWFDGNTPVPVANKRDTFAFALVRVSNGWSVLGNYSTYG